MTIRARDSLYSTAIHVTDGKKGFYPYSINVKPSGVYLEGAGAHLLHISLHHRPKQKEPSLSECHMRIPRETEERITMHNFNESKLFKWDRKRAEPGRAHQACLLIFPGIYADPKFAALPTHLTDENVSTIDLQNNAAIVSFWYSGLEDHESYFGDFSQIIQLVKLPKSTETFVIALQYEKTRDYKIFTKAPDHGRFEFRAKNDHETDPKYSLSAGWYGQHCMGLVHGEMQESIVGQN